MKLTDEQFNAINVELYNNIIAFGNEPIVECDGVYKKVKYEETKNIWKVVSASSEKPEKSAIELSKPSKLVKKYFERTINM